MGDAYERVEGSRKPKLGPSAIDSSSSKNIDLRTKADQFKRSLSSLDPSDVKYNGQLLYQLLKNICAYHGKDPSQVIRELDEGKSLDVSRLRFKLCNQTTIEKLMTLDK